MPRSPKKEHRRQPLLLPQTRASVDLGAVEHNLRALKGLTAPGTRIMAVVKADAYGHGAVAVAGAAMAAGADFLAVARISEAAALRDAGIDAPMLLFGDVLPEQAPWMAEHHVRATVTDLAGAKAMAARLDPQGPDLKIHIKVDTGMGRLGYVHSSLQAAGTAPENPIDDILALGSLPKLRVEGIYSHLSRADEQDKTHANSQIKQFIRLTDRLKGKGFDPGIRHIANSAGTIDLPQSHLDMIRPGIAMYGLWPSGDVDKSRLILEPAMTIRSKIIQVKSVPKGFDISYGATHVTPSPTVIATVPVGYADGYSRQLSNRGHMLVRGMRAPVLGRICMDFTMIDVGHIPGVTAGDEVVLMGSQGDETISADDIAKLTNTINYEVTAGLTGRIPLRHTRP
ncbi:MAG: alanine racemase [Desulfobacter sp.]|nr:MAG: alanine racemase [Desulfobacter sp.]